MKRISNFKIIKNIYSNDKKSFSLFTSESNFFAVVKMQFGKVCDERSPHGQVMAV